MGNTPPQSPQPPLPRQPQRRNNQGPQRPRPIQGGSTSSSASNPQHNFEYKNIPNAEFKCSGCGITSLGKRYRCTSHCDEVFHDECKTFKKTEDGHKHKYELRSHKKIFKCDGCKQEGFGKRFRCDQCGHELHTICKFPKNCINEWLTQIPFTFHVKSEQNLICGACTNNIDGYYYHCIGHVMPPGDEDGLYLHPCCMNLKSFLRPKLDMPEDDSASTNENELRYTLSPKVKDGKKCVLCNHRKLKRPYSGLSYVCDRDESEICYHVYCVWQVVHESWVTANGQEVNNISKTLETVATKQLETKGRSSSSFLHLAGKILLMILKMVASTLMGDPTFGIVHLFETLSK